MTEAAPASTSAHGSRQWRSWVHATLASLLCFLALESLIRTPCAYDAQQPVFFATFEFLLAHAVQAGGLSDYLGRLLSQAWCLSIFGSFASAAVIFGILLSYGALLTALSRRRRPLLPLVLSLPILWMHCSYEHPMKSDVVVLFALLAGLAYTAAQDFTAIRRSAAFVVTFVLVFATAGVLGAGLFVAFSVALVLTRRHGRGLVEVLFLLAVGAGLLWGAHRLVWVSAPVEDLLAFFGTTSAYQLSVVVTVTFVALAPLVARAASGAAFFVPARLPYRIAMVLLLAGGGAAGVALCLDKDARRRLSYDLLAQQGRWSEILLLAPKDPSDTRLAFDHFYLTRALFHGNKLFETLVFSHPSAPLPGLAFMPPDENGVTALANGDLFFEMGAVAHAIRYATEAIAVYGPSPRLLRRLAICYAAEGKIEMARSMTALLERGLVGRSWARAFARQLDNPDALSRDPTIARLRELAPRSEFVAQPTSLSHEFRHIWSAGSTFNKMAMEYYLASAPALIGQYLDFMVFAGDCHAGDRGSCDRLASELGESFWYKHFVRSPRLFDLAQSVGGQDKAAP